MTDTEARTPDPANLRQAWGVADDAQAERLDRLMRRVAELLGEQLAGDSTQEMLAARALLAEAGREPPVEAWIAELEGGDLPAERQKLLLDSLVLYGERFGFHAAIAGWAQKLGADPQADEALRAGALCALARSRPEPLIAEWLKGLGSDDPEAKLGAIQLLTESRSPLAVRPLASLVVEGDARIVEAAMWGIGEIGLPDPVAESVLADAIKARFCPREATVALGKMGGPEALRVLLGEASRGDAVPALMGAARLVERHLPFDVPDNARQAHVTTLKNLVARELAPAAHALAVVILARLGHPLTDEEINAALQLT